MLGGRLDAVGAVAEVDDVEVLLEDVVLGEGLLELDGEAQLLELAAVGVLDDLALLVGGLGVLEQHQLDVLLGDARSTLGDPARLLVAQERPERALGVERTVVVVPRVLDGEDGPLHHRGDLLEGDLDAVLVVERGDHGAVGGEEPAALRQRRVLEVAVHVLESVGRRLGGEAQDAGERDRETGHEGAGQSTDDDEHHDVRHKSALSCRPGHRTDKAHSAVAYAVTVTGVCRKVADLLTPLSPCPPRHNHKSGHWGLSLWPSLALPFCQDVGGTSAHRSPCVAEVRGGTTTWHGMATGFGWPHAAVGRARQAVRPGSSATRCKTVCMGCPVRTECLAEALDGRIEWGVWGGMTERERRAVLRRRPTVTSWRQLLETARAGLRPGLPPARRTQRETAG